VEAFRTGLLAGVCVAGLLLRATDGAEPAVLVELPPDPPQAPISSAKPTPAVESSTCERRLVGLAVRLKVTCITGSDRRRQRRSGQGIG
jgi:hypothetical protein